MLGIILVVIGLVILTILAIKGVPILFATAIASIFVLASQGVNVVEGITQAYMTGFANYFMNYFLIFTLGAIFGKLAEVSGATDSIAKTIVDKLGEKYVGLNYKYLLCDQEYELLVMDEILCNVEYQADGSSANMFRQYLNNPKGFAFLRTVYMKYDKTFKRKFMNCIHYVSSSIISKNKKFLKESPEKGLTILAIPFGIALTFYIKQQVKKMN